MGANPPVTIVNVGYRSANYWVVSAGTSRLLVDLGWPGMLGALLANLERKGIPLREISYGLATHYHLDHAGCAQDLKHKGVRLIVTPEQVPAIPAMKQWTKPSDNYLDISLHDNVVLSIAESRAFLKRAGMDGEMLHTPGHSDDSVTLVLDNGCAFTGDLTKEAMVGPEDAEVVARSWQLLREHGVTTIYGGHGPVHPVPVPYSRR